MRINLVVCMNLIVSTVFGSLPSSKQIIRLEHLQSIQKRYSSVYIAIMYWCANLLPDTTSFTTLTTSFDQSHLTLVQSIVWTPHSSIMIINPKGTSQQHKHNSKTKVIRDSDLIVLILESVQNLQEIIPKDDIFYWNNRARFLVIALSTELNSYQDSRAILQKLWEVRVLKVAVINVGNVLTEIQDVNNSTLNNTHVYVMSYNPFLNITYATNATLATLWNTAAVLNEAFSHTKTADLHGYALKTTCVYAKFSPSFSYWLSDNGTYQSEGAYTNVFKSFSKYMNYTTDIISTHGWFQFGQQLQNGTWTGVLGDLVTKKAELAYTILGVLPTRYKVIEYTGYVSLPPASILVPKGELKSRWVAVTELYSTEVWYFIIGTYFIAAFICKIIKINTSGIANLDISHLFLDLFGIAFLQSRLLSHVNSERILIFLWTYVSLIFVSVYQSGIVSVLTVPRYYPDMDTLKELVESKIVLKGTSIYKKALNQVSDPILTALHNKYELDGNYDQLLKSVATGNKIAVVGSRHLLLYYGNKDHSWFAHENPFHIMREHLGFISGAIGVPKGSVFVSRFNTLLRRMHQSGLTSKWFADMIQGSEISFISTNPSNTNTVVMTLEHLHVGFYILVTGSLISLFVLLVELVYWKIKKCVGDRTLDNPVIGCYNFCVNCVQAQYVNYGQHFTK